MSFGLSPQLRADVAAVGLDAWLEQQLNPAAISDDDVDARIAQLPSISATSAANKARNDNEVKNELTHATLLRAVMSNRQLHEVMVEFWSDHFSIHLDGGRVHLKTADDRAVGRANSLTTFADVLVASAHSPAMLEYLDNAKSNANSRDGVNENYGRELLELHTMGITDNVQPYTEEDVIGVALVMSGWTIDRDSQEFVYDPGRHHSGPVAILGGAWSTPGNSGQAGYQDGISLLRFLAGRPETARHLATKLARRFVADDPPTALVDQLAAVYLANGTSTVAVLRALFASPEFRQPATSKVWRPFGLVAAMLRAYGLDLDASPDTDGSKRLRWTLEGLGHVPFGWPAPNGYPDVAPYWISSDGLLRRWGFGGRLANGWIDAFDTDPVRLMGELPATWGELADAVGVALLDGVFPAIERDLLLAHVGRAEADAVDPANSGLIREFIAVAFCTVTFQLR